MDLIRPQTEVHEWSVQSDTSEIVRRHLPGPHVVLKRSVVTPQTKWFKGVLRPCAEERIESLRRSACIPESVFAKAEAFIADPVPGNSFPVWQLINLSFFFGAKH